MKYKTNNCQSENLELIKECIYCLLFERSFGPMFIRGNVIRVLNIKKQVLAGCQKQSDFDIDSRIDVAWQGHQFMTLLLAAAAKENSFAVYAFIDLCGADVNQCTNDGWTPLHFACWNGDTWTVMFLLKKKANYFLTNDTGETALDIAIIVRDLPENFARRNEYTEIIQAIKLVVNRNAIFNWLKKTWIGNSDVN